MKKEKTMYTEIEIENKWEGEHGEKHVKEVITPMLKSMGLRVRVVVSGHLPKTTEDACVPGSPLLIRTKRNKKSKNN